MQTLVGGLAACLLLCSTAQAQVINGEGTYEGSSLHTPPPVSGTETGTRPDESKKPGGHEKPADPPPAR